MTVQFSHILTNEYNDLDLGGLDLYGVLVNTTGNVFEGDPYVFKQQPNEAKKSKVVGSYCHRRFCYRFKITNEGKIILTHYEYPCLTLFQFDDDTSEEEKKKVFDNYYPKPDIVNEELVGDFWLFMRAGWHGKENIYIPFKDGKVLANKLHWRVEDFSILYAKNSYTQSIKEAIYNFFILNFLKK